MKAIFFRINTNRPKLNSAQKPHQKQTTSVCLLYFICKFERVNIVLLPSQLSHNLFNKKTAMNSGFIKTSFIICLIFLSAIACKDKAQKPTKGYDVPTDESTANLSAIEKSQVRGKNLYDAHCLQCHMPTGKGLTGVYPPLAGSNWLSEKRKSVIHAVKYGLNGEITVNGETYNNIMLDLGLENQEVADVLNYIMNAWENKQEKPVTAEEVAQIKK